MRNERTWLGCVCALALVAGCDAGTTTGNTGGAGGEGQGASNAGGGTPTTSDTAMTTTSDTAMTTTSSSTTTSSNTIPCGDAPISFANQVQPVFSASCGNATSCHLKSAASAGLALKPGQSFGELVGQTSNSLACSNEILVIPGDPANSYLIKKITDAPDICGSAMPEGAFFDLSAADAQIIIDWVCQGAQNN